MNYYILKSRNKRWITGFKEVLDPTVYPYEQVLTPQQGDFFESNPTASIPEVLAMQLTVVTPVVFNLDNYKTSIKNNLSQEAFDVRTSFLPEYKIYNALLGVVGYENKSTLYATICTAFRDEFYRCAELIDEATDKDEVDAVYASNQFYTLKATYE